MKELSPPWNYRPSQKSEVTVLPARSPVVVTSTSHAGLLKVSVSEPIVVNQDPCTEKSTLDDNAKSTSQLQTEPLYADTSDVEELLDSSGVDTFPPVTSTLAWDTTALSEFEGEFQDKTGHSDIEQEQYRAKVASADEQLTVKGRSVIRKYFTETTPVQLAPGHTTVVSNEDQIHTILRTVAEESVISSYHMMKSLQLHTTSGDPQDKNRSLPRRCATPARQVYESSGDESSLGGHTTDGYTSGAINSDEDPYQLGSISGTDGLGEFDPPVKVPETPLGVNPHTSRTEATTPTSGSGYSSTDHQQLSELRRARETTTTSAIPPRKRRRLLSKYGKYMKDAYFKGI